MESLLISFFLLVTCDLAFDSHMAVRSNEVTLHCRACRQRIPLAQGSPMATEARGWRLDVAYTADEILVLLARHGSLAANNELQLRARKCVSAWITLLCRRHRLTDADRDDLQQQLFFCTHAAIAAFDAEELAKADGCSFRTLLRRVVERRVQDFARKNRRYQRRFPASLDDARVGKMGGAQSREFHGHYSARLGRTRSC